MWCVSLQRLEPKYLCVCGHLLRMLKEMHTAQAINRLDGARQAVHVCAAARCGYCCQCSNMDKSVAGLKHRTCSHRYP